jgi:F-type H+-transporting ATPase subunit delta
LRDSTVARNYAQALFQAGVRADELPAYGAALEAVAGAIEADPRVRLTLESPRVPKRVKTELMARALAGRAPAAFVRFVAAVVHRGRQGLIPVIHHEYQNLLDVKLNRVHAGITLARAPDNRLKEEIRNRLAEILGKEVVPHFKEDPSLIGGMLVRVGDLVMDGSVRRQMAVLRRKMLGG